jgi:hypothetical protein
MKTKDNSNVNFKNKKTAWDLIKEIPDTPAQRKIDREIAAIERRYEEKIKRKAKVTKQSNNQSYINKKRKNINRVGEFGLFAGKIWNTLSSYGPLDESSLIDNTNLNIDDFFIGIGWLARENKITKEMNYYKLGKTNLTYEIGENAGRIWKYLNLNGKAGIFSIIKSTELKDEDLFSAIGWLLRENKIKYYYKEKELIFELT